MSVIKTALMITLVMFSNHLGASNNDDDDQPSAQTRMAQQPLPNLISFNSLSALSLFANDDPRLVESLKKDILIFHMGAFTGNQQHFMEVWSHQLKKLPYNFLVENYLDGRFNALMTQGKPYEKLLNLKPDNVSPNGTFCRTCEVLPVILLKPNVHSGLLKHLDLFECSLYIINGLSTLTNLESLKVINNPLLSLDLSGLNNLKTLDASGTPLKRIEGLHEGNVSQLIDLLLRGCKSLEPLCVGFECLEHLVTLDLSEVQFVDIPLAAGGRWVDKLTKLRYLNLQGTPLKQFRSLESLTALIELTLSPHHLREIPDLAETLATLSFQPTLKTPTCLCYERTLK